MRFHTGHVLGGAAFIASSVAVFVPLGLPLIMGVTALTLLVLRRTQLGVWPSPPPLLCGLFALVLVWGLIGAAWSIDPAATFTRLFRLLGIFAAGLIAIDAAGRLTENELRVAGSMLFAGFMLALVLLAAERGLQAPFRNILQPDLPPTSDIWDTFNRGVTVLILFVWPVALVARRWNRLAAILVWFALLGLVSIYSSGAALIALAAGGIVFVSMRIAPKIVPVALAGIVAIFILSGPLVFSKFVDTEFIMDIKKSVPRSGYHRLLIWNFSASRTMDRPFTGWGLDTSRSIPGGKTESNPAGGEELMPLHPHNGALQIWLELGFPGILMLLALIGGILVSIRRSMQSVVVRAVVAGLSITTMGISFLSYGVWQSWWMSAIWLAAIFTAMFWRGTAGNTLPAP